MRRDIELIEGYQAWKDSVKQRQFKVTAEDYLIERAKESAYERVLAVEVELNKYQEGDFESAEDVIENIITIIESGV